MLFEAPGANQYLSAAILDPETLYQKSTSAGTPLFPERLKQLGIMPGVKPHLKVYALPGQSGSTIMQARPISALPRSGTRPRRLAPEPFCAWQPATAASWTFKKG